jgi:hypothetical protein
LRALLYFDTGAGAGINLIPTGSGKVTALRFTHSATAGFAGYGVNIGSGGTIAGVHFTDHLSLINTKSGALIAGGSDITVASSQFVGNSNFTSNAWNGVDITGGNGIMITGSTIGAQDGQNATQGLGIALSGSTNNVTIKNNNLNGNNTASLADTSTGTFRFISDNQGIEVPAIASAAALDIGTLDETTVNLTGTTNVTSFLRPTQVEFDQRNVTFVKADSGSLTVLGATLAQGSWVSCIYVVSTSQWFCK